MTNVAPRTPGGSTPRTAAQQVAAVRRLVVRLPFTTGYVAITMVLSVVLGTLWQPVDGTPWFDLVGYGLPALVDGRWYTLATGTFFALVPGYYVFVAGGFALVTGFAEWRLGTRRTALITCGYQLVAVLLTAAAFWLVRDTDWLWATQRGTELDVGFSAGMMAVAAVASATLRPPWRLRLQLLIWIYATYSLLFIGQMSDAEHFVAVLLSLPLATRLAGSRGLTTRAPPEPPELRQLALLVVPVSAALQLLGAVLPDRLTPFGRTGDDVDLRIVLALVLVATLPIAAGLRRGHRWAWWGAVLVLAVPAVLAATVSVGALPVGALPVGGQWQFAANVLWSLGVLTLLIIEREAFQVSRRPRPLAL